MSDQILAPLFEALEQLVECLGEDKPRFTACKILEIPAGSLPDARGRIVARREDLRDPQEFQTRFEELIMQHPPWINVGCLGVLDDKLIVSIETPHVAAGRTGRTSINYSGPSNLLVAAKWDVESMLTFE